MGAPGAQHWKVGLKPQMQTIPRKMTTQTLMSYELMLRDYFYFRNNNF